MSRARARVCGWRAPPWTPIVWAALLPAVGVVGQTGSGVLTLEAQARRAIAAGDTDAAVEAYSALADAEPQEPKWVVGAVEALARGGRFHDALDTLDGARKRMPAAIELLVLSAKVTMLRAESLAADGRRDSYVTFAYEDAAEIAREALAQDAGNRDARLILAEAEYSLGNLDAALNQAREVERRYPDHPGGHIVVAKVMVGRFLAAKQRIGKEAPTGKVLEELASAAADARKTATRALEAAIAADPERAFPHKLLGDVHAWNANPAQALLSYGAALGRDPATPVDHAWLASNAEPDALVAIYRKAFAEYHARKGASPMRAAVLSWYLAKTLFDQKKFAPAHDLMLAAVAANPEYTNALYYAWVASYWAGDTDAAEREAAAYARYAAPGFADLLRTLPDRKQTLTILVFLAARAFKGGRLEESGAINHVVALAKDSSEAWNNYAFVCRERGKYAESLEAYERALELEPESPQLLNDAAVVLHYHLTTRENVARAKAMYERAVEFAERLLGDAELPAEERVTVEQALKDAHANLAKLGGG